MHCNVQQLTVQYDGLGGRKGGAPGSDDSSPRETKSNEIISQLYLMQRSERRFQMVHLSVFGYRRQVGSEGSFNTMVDPVNTVGVCNEPTGLDGLAPRLGSLVANAGVAPGG